MSAVIVALSSNWQASTPEDTLGDGADTDADAVALGDAEAAFGVGDAASGLPRWSNRRAGRSSTTRHHAGHHGLQQTVGHCAQLNRGMTLPP